MLPSDTNPRATGSRPAALEPSRSLAALARLRARIRRLYLVAGWLRVALIAGALGAVSFGLDYFLHLPVLVRGVLLLAFALALGRYVRRGLLGPLGRTPSDEELALLVESDNPQLEQRLITAVQLSRPGSETGRYVSPALLAATVEELEGDLKGVAFDRVLRLGGLRRSAGGVTLLAVIFLAAWVAIPGHLSVWFQRNVLLRSIRWPKGTLVELEPGTPRVVAIGDSLPVVVRLLKGRPALAAVESRFPSGLRRHHTMELKERASWDVVLVAAGPDQGALLEILKEEGLASVTPVVERGSGLLGRALRQRQAEALARRLRQAGARVDLRGFDVFEHEFRNVSQPMSFRVLAGDDETEWFDVEVRLRPRIDMRRIEVAVTLPDYTGRGGERRTQKHGNLRVPTGSLVEYRMATNVPVRRAFVVRREGEAAAERTDTPLPGAGAARWPDAGAVALDLEEGQRLGGSFRVEGSGYYYFQFEDENGFRSVKPQRFRIQAIPDRKPVVRVVEPSRQSEEVSPEATVAIRVHLQDDYCLRRGVLEGYYYPPSPPDGAGSDAAGRVEQEILLPGVAAEDPRAAGKEHQVELALEVRNLKTAPGGGAPGDPPPPRPEPGARFEFFAVAEDFGDRGDGKGNIGESQLHVLEIVDKARLESLLMDQLMVVRDQLDQILARQRAVRQEVEKFQKDARLLGGLAPQEAGKLARHRHDQQRIREGLERQAREVDRIVARIEANRLKDESWKNWVRARGGEVSALGQQSARAVEAPLEALERRARAEPQDPGVLSEVTREQRRLEDDLQSVVLKLTEFGDVNAIVELLRIARRRQNELLEETKRAKEARDHE